MGGFTKKRAISSRAIVSVRTHLATVLRAARMGVHLSQNKIAKLSGLSTKYVSEVERGLKGLTTDSLWMLVQALRRAGSPITMDVLFPTLPNLGGSTTDDTEGGESE